MPNRPRLSVAMIVKNEAEHLEKTLASLKKIYDELVIVDTGSTDNTKEIAKKFGAKIYDFHIDPFRFDAARNESFSHCTGEWILWLDADDFLVNPEGVLEEIEAAQPQVDVFHAAYNYAFNQLGMCVARHDKERLIRNNKALKWAGPLHEALIPLRTPVVMRTDKFEVNHDKDDAGHYRSAERNYAIIKEVVKNDGVDDTDPRNLYSLANAALGLEKWEEAISFFELFTTRSGWKDEIYMALHRAALCSRKIGKIDQAIEYEFRALSILPNCRDAYLGLGESYLQKEEWDKAEVWLLLSFDQSVQKPAAVYNPAEYTFTPWWLLAHVYTNKALDGNGYENVEAALKCFAECKKHVKDDPELLEKIKVLEDMKEKQEVAQAAILVGSYIKAENDDLKLKSYTEALPKAVHDHPSIWKMRNSLSARKETSGKDLAIFCGACYKDWNPEDLTKGIGGSEEAVIHMARELAKRGWNVEVYNSVPEEQVFDGVKYKPFWSLNTQDHYDVFIAWRLPALFDVLSVQSKKTYLWLHDVVQDGEFTPERLQKIDKVIVLSEFHRSLFPSIPEEKVWRSANGLHWPDMGVTSERKPWKFVNTSAPDRGLKCMLEMWPKIKERYPEAEFHWFYGWETYDAHNINNPERMAYKENLLRLLNQDGVFERGRVSHAEIAKELASADLWVYPTEFPEISCISAMKAQALGAIPVVTDYGALKETVQSGIKIPYKDIYTNPEAQKAFIDALSDARAIDRETCKDVAKQFSWEKVADEWNKIMSE